MNRVVFSRLEAYCLCSHQEVPYESRILVGGREAHMIAMMDLLVSTLAGAWKLGRLHLYEFVETANFPIGA